jgi:hypothetical protein
MSIIIANPAPSSAHSSRQGQSIQLIVVHHRPQTAEQLLHDYTASESKSAPHYLIDIDGSILQLVAETRAAHHTGTALWNQRHRNIDRISIGIDLAQIEQEPSNDQLIALDQLLASIYASEDLDEAALLLYSEGQLQPYLPSTPLYQAATPPAPLVLGDEDDFGLWMHLQTETFKPRSNGLKYTLNDLNRSQAFSIYAIKHKLGAPITANLPTPLVVDDNSYNYQSFARGLIFNVGRNYGQVQNLTELIGTQIPAAGHLRALLEASFNTAINQSRITGTVQGHEGLRADWRFHLDAIKLKLGPALNGNYATEDGVYAVQVFACDTLYTPRKQLSDSKRLSETAPSDPAYHQIWAETYKVCGAPYDANHPFQRYAAEQKLGTPLTGAYQSEYNGQSYTIQVFALDTLYSAADGQIQRLSQHKLPNDIQQWNSTPVAVAVQAAAPRPNVGQSPPKPAPVVSAGTPSGDPSWPPFPNFRMLYNGGERGQVFGNFHFTRGNGVLINIDPAWVNANIVQIEIPQLKRLPNVKHSGLIKCHRLVADQFRQLWAAWEGAGLLHLILSYDGDWYPRAMTGNGNELSMHAYGAAFDINARWNAFNVQAALHGQTGSVRALVPIANQLGFFWGGHFRYDKTTDKSDGMHFEWAKHI